MRIRTHIYTEHIIYGDIVHTATYYVHGDIYEKLAIPGRTYNQAVMRKQIEIIQLHGAVT